MSKFNLKTGDLLLLDNEGKFGIFKIFTKLIQYFTKSKYSHTAMVLKDPTFIHPSLKGYYVWESSWEGKADPQDGKIKLGVQITPFDEIYNKYRDDSSYIYVRRINCDPEVFNDEVMSDIHKVVYDKPYDIFPLDWIEAIKHKDPSPDKTSRFWCSALVGYIYTQVGILAPDTDWSVLSPADFSMEHYNVTCTEKASLSREEQIL